MGSGVLLLVTLSAFCFVSGGLTAHVAQGACSMGPMFWCSRLSNAQECNAVEHCVPLWRQRGSMLSARRREPSVMCHMSEVVVLAIKSSLQGGQALEKLLVTAPEACDTLTRFAGMCKNLTGDNLMTVVVLLKSGVSPKVITELMGHCDSTAAKSISVNDVLKGQGKPPHKGTKARSIPATRTFRPHMNAKVQQLKYKKPVDVSSIDCSLCVRVISYMDQALQANKTEEEIEKGLETVCQFLHGTLRQACDHVIEKYTPLLINMFVAEFPPAKICQMLGMCPKTHLPAVPFTPKPKPVMPVVPRSNGVQCSVCVRVMSYVDTMLAQESTVEEIEQALETVCNFVPIPRAECDSFIKQYTPLLIHLIVSELTPVQICQVIGMCPKQTADLAVMKKDNSVECDFCVHVINYIDGFLEKNSTAQEIEQVLEKVCAYLPAAVRTECDSLIEQFTPVLIELLVSQFTPREICHAIGLCPAKTNLTVPKKTPCLKKKAANSGLQCTFCVQVFSYVDHFLTENSTEVEIEQALERVCHFLPSHVQEECNSLIEEFTPVLIHLIVADFTPREICHALGLCDTQVKKPKAIQKPKNSVECTMCVHMMNYVDSFLQKNSTLQDIERAIEQVCAYLPKAVETECRTIVEEFTPDLVHLIVVEFTPIQICKAIEMCPQKMYQKVRKLSELMSIPHHHRMRRPGVCHRGPQHWCKSVEIAKSCGMPAMLVCHRMVWKH